jgi:glycosyltransferase involved in cell wall biosynthesis
MRPVVAYNNAGLIDSVKDQTSGIICKNNTPEQLAIEIQELINDKTTYKSLSEGAKKWSKNFSWDISRKISLEVINQIYKSN